MSTNASTVYVIDDDTSLSQALCLLFESAGLSCQTYSDVEDFLAAEIGPEPGCLVLDVRLPGINGLEFQSKLGEYGINLPVVMMTGHADVPMSVRAMKAGAVDFLPKPFGDQELLDAVGIAIEKDCAARRNSSTVSGVVQMFQAMSLRERQVMTLVTSGLLNKQVAGQLGLSEISVKIHRGSAMRKMGARTLPDLVRMAEIVRGTRMMADERLEV
ncbi:response regulator transcription factor [Rhizobium glycinendophyticum]|uniref:Response regulator transcription factor n=1 Tax=Rhizobium glycinendophyticum TaxID=2589807 RepID=A0A504TTI1_9HYPH|nr:response regulator [Rhizobium glycinendophyticum]TPP06048.1 response regulator transcription factor [Rhizobium glycinendophyticum]